MQTHFSGSDLLNIFWQADWRALCHIRSCLSLCPAKWMLDGALPIIPHKTSINSIAVANWEEIRCSCKTEMKCMLLRSGTQMLYYWWWTCCLTTQTLSLCLTPVPALLGQESSSNPVLRSAVLLRHWSSSLLGAQVQMWLSWDVIILYAPTVCGIWNQLFLSLWSCWYVISLCSLPKNLTDFYVFSVFFYVGFCFLLRAGLLPNKHLNDHLS